MTSQRGANSMPARTSSTDAYPPTSLDDRDFEVFRRRLLAHAASQLPSDDDAQLTEIARSCLEFATVRAPGQILVRVQPVSPNATRVDIVTEDAPFVIDSVQAELRRRGTPADHVLHPQLIVSRDPSGRLVAVHDIDDTGEVPEGAALESWTVVELGPLTQPGRQALADDLRRVLIDVHNAV